MMEEAAEVIQACSKILRCMSADPCASTPVEMFEAQAKLYEEFNDLLVTADAARILPDDMDTGDNIKWLRWASRTEEAIDHGE